MGSTTTVLGIIAGDTGVWIAEYLSANHTPHDFVEGVGQSRTNVKVFAKSSETITEFNEKGNPVNQEIMNRVWQKARSYAEKSEFMVFSGSVPVCTGNSGKHISEGSDGESVLDCGEKVSKASHYPRLEKAIYYKCNKYLV